MGEKQEFVVQGVHEYQYNGETHCEAVSDDKAKFWSVYRVDHQGLSSALCDCPTRADAEFIATRLNFVKEMREELNAMLAQ